MKNALLLSLSFHVAVGLIWSLVVEITHVRFVPRQVYTVNIVTPAELKKPAPPEPKPVQTPAVTPKPAEEEAAEEEVLPPPERPKPRPKPKPKEEKPKQVKKTVPTTEPKPPPEPEPSTEDTSKDTEPVTTGDISIDGEDFPFAYYITNMRRKIAARWQVPGQSIEERFCIVYFKVTRTGAIHSASIETSSGNLLFDQAAVRAVLQANPLPALPPSYAEEELGVHFSFAYRRE